MAASTLNFQSGALSSTSMRYHELAVQRWLNKTFLLRWGLPIPVVFSSPMDAHAEFSRLWAAGNDAYKYLLDVKDEKGAPIYLPHPAPVRYPIIGVMRRNYKFRPSHNFSIHNMRHLQWPTVSDAAVYTEGKVQQGSELHLGDMGEAVVARYPMAFDYRFQIDFFCNRPDTQAFFLSQLMREFWRTGGSQLQTWIIVSYPLLGDKLARLYLDGDIENLTPEEPEQDKNTEFRVSFTVVLEGYDIDVRYKVHPVLWKLTTRAGAASPLALDQAFAQTSRMDFESTIDMRDTPEENPSVAYRVATTDMPSSGTYAADTNA